MCVSLHIVRCQKRDTFRNQAANLETWIHCAGPDKWLKKTLRYVKWTCSLSYLDIMWYDMNMIWSRSQVVNFVSIPRKQAQLRPLDIVSDFDLCYPAKYSIVVSIWSSDIKGFRCKALFRLLRHDFRFQSEVLLLFHQSAAVDSVNVWVNIALFLGLNASSDLSWHRCRIAGMFLNWYPIDKHPIF